jgi:hypothetical protein
MVLLDYPGSEDVSGFLRGISGSPERHSNTHPSKVLNPGKRFLVQ